MSCEKYIQLYILKLEATFIFCEQKNFIRRSFALRVHQNLCCMGWGFASDPLGELTALPDSVAGFKGASQQGWGEKGEERDLKEENKKDGREGKKIAP